MDQRRSSFSRDAMQVFRSWNTESTSTATRRIVGNFDTLPLQLNEKIYCSRHSRFHEQVQKIYVTSVHTFEVWDPRKEAANADGGSGRDEGDEKVWGEDLE